MKKYDFLFLYEVKNRELENICLLKYELERRGYSVKLLETWRLLHYPRLRRLEANVLVTFAFYDDGQARMCCAYAKNVKKIVNMQWEQVYSIGDEEEDASIYHIKESALNASHISWGKYNSDKLIHEFGVPEKNVWLTGHLSFDFFKPRLNGYYLNREELCEKYNLDSKKKLCLFISSFSYVDMPASTLTGIYEETANKVDDILNVSKKSQKTIFDWVRNVLPRHSDVVFIYRPHPAEVGNKELFNLEKTIQNFRVIRDESVKQWIINCDKVYSWYSTSIAEAYAAHKEISVIRPVAFPRKMDIRLYEGCNAISKESEFEESFNKNSSISIDEDMMRYYYSFFDDYTYEMISDKLEEMLKSNEHQFDYSEKFPALNLFRRIRGWVSRYVWNVLIGIGKHNKYLSKVMSKGKRLGKYFGEYDFVRRMAKNNYSTKKEIRKIERHIKETIERNTKSKF